MMLVLILLGYASSFVVAGSLYDSTVNHDLDTVLTRRSHNTLLFDSPLYQQLHRRAPQPVRGQQSRQRAREDRNARILEENRPGPSDAYVVVSSKGPAKLTTQRHQDPKEVNEIPPGRHGLMWKADNFKAVAGAESQPLPRAQRSTRRVDPHDRLYASGKGETAVMTVKTPPGRSGKIKGEATGSNSHEISIPPNTRVSRILSVPQPGAHVKGIAEVPRGGEVMAVAVNAPEDVVAAELARVDREPSPPRQ